MHVNKWYIIGHKQYIIGDVHVYKKYINGDVRVHIHIKYII